MCKSFIVENSFMFSSEGSFNTFIVASIISNTASLFCAISVRPTISTLNFLAIFTTSFKTCFILSCFDAQTSGKMLSKKSILSSSSTVSDSCMIVLFTIVSVLLSAVGKICKIFFLVCKYL